MMSGFVSVFAASATDSIGNPIRGWSRHGLHDSQRKTPVMLSQFVSDVLAGLPILSFIVVLPPVNLPDRTNPYLAC